MNLAGVFVISETRHRICSRGFVVLALATYLLPAVVAGDAVIPGAGGLAIHSSHAKRMATPNTSNTVAGRRMSVGSPCCRDPPGHLDRTTYTPRP
jgi:hypothetical protein